MNHLPRLIRWIFPRLLLVSFRECGRLAHRHIEGLWARPPQALRGPVLCTTTCAVMLLAGCTEREPLPGPYYMTDEDQHAQWDTTVLSGGVIHELQDSVLTIRQGEPISVVRYTGLPPEEIPVMDYEIAWEARRVQGHDFFSAITFPVGSLETCLTAVIGGWGGGLVGFSSLDELDASENGYSTERDFKNGRWYHFRLEVRQDRVSLWIDGQLATEAPVAGRKISLRPGDVEFSAPLGFATYFTEAEIRHVVMRHLRAPTMGF